MPKARREKKTRQQGRGIERGAWLCSSCTQRNPWKQMEQRLGRHSLQGVSAALSNLPLGWHTQCLPHRTCHSPCLSSSAITPHWLGAVFFPAGVPVFHQTMKSPFCIPSALDSLTLVAGWPEALPGCPSPGPHGRSFLPALLLPLPDPLALLSPLVASDHKWTVSFNPPA